MFNNRHLPQLPTSLYPLRRNLLQAVIVTLLLAQNGMGTGLPVTITIFALWMLTRIVRCISKPEQRRLQGQKILIWSASVFLITVAQLIHAHNQHRYAQDLVDQIQLYARQHGEYPPDLESLGTSREREKTQLLALVYGRYAEGPSAGKPFFSYADNFFMFAKENYDFEKQVWEQTD